MTKRKQKKPDVPRASDPTAADLHKGDAAFDPAAYEENNVHEVYETIATHFSDTRYKPWPLIPAFLETLPAGSIGADLGCGNGKYLGVRSCFVQPLAMSEKQLGKRRQQDHDILIVGMDRSANLIDHAAHNLTAAYGECQEPQSVTSAVDGGESAGIVNAQRNEVAVSDAIHSNLRAGSVDFAISIATIHHMATWARRRDAVAEMIRIVAPQAQGSHSTVVNLDEDQGEDRSPYDVFGTGKGRFMIVVWALEQRGESRRRFEDLATAAQEESDDARPENAPIGLDLLVPWVLKERKDQQAGLELPPAGERKVYQRFYHVFREGELEALVDDAAKSVNAQRLNRGQKALSVECEVAGWERGNWYGAWQCTLSS